MKKISGITIFVILFLSFSITTQAQFTNNGNFRTFSGVRISFFGDVYNNSSFIDSGLVCSFSGTAFQTIGGTSVITFNNLTINNAAGVSLNKTINIYGTLTLNFGMLYTTSSNLLVMQNGSATSVGTSSSTSYINGPMIYQKSTSGSSVLNFPVGKGADCRPLALTLNHSGTTLYNYLAESFNSNANGLGYTLPNTIDRVSGVHYWTISRTDSSGTSQPTANLSGNQTIQIYFGPEDDVIDGSSLSICKNTYSSVTNWIDIGGTGAPAYNSGIFLTGSVTSTSSPTAFNSFSAFTLADKSGGANPLPITLLDFNALPDGNSVSVNWTTATEINNNHFEVEHSADGERFEYVSTVNAEGGGNSNTKQYYHTIDNNPYKGSSYYRLKQVDNNGKFVYSDLALVNLGDNNEINIYPNPAADILNIDISDAWFNSNAKIIDILGNEVASFNLNSNSNKIDLNNLKSGSYYLVIYVNNIKTEKFKLIIAK